MTASTSSGLCSSCCGFLGTRPRGTARLVALAAALLSGRWEAQHRTLLRGSHQEEKIHRRSQPSCGAQRRRSDGAAAAAATLNGEWEEEVACGKKKKRYFWERRRVRRGVLYDCIAFFSSPLFQSDVAHPSGRPFCVAYCCG